MSLVMMTPFDQPVPAVGNVHSFFAEIGDRSEWDLIDACSAADMAQRLSREPSTVDLLERLADRLDALAAVQRTLRFPRTPKIDLGDGLRDLCCYMADAYFAKGGIFVRLVTDSILMPSHKAWTILVIVAELLQNAFERGSLDEPGAITVEASEGASGPICIFRDDGNARRHLQGQDRRLGMSVLGSFAEKAGGFIAYPDCPCDHSVEIWMPDHQSVEIGQFKMGRIEFPREISSVF